VRQLEHPIAEGVALLDGEHLPEIIGQSATLHE
jgi:hypothetical protein